ncbi:MAG: 30S ribosome-binding factor RbfA [Ruminococcus sp.]
MANHKLSRTTEDIKRELTAIFRELKDPRVQDAFLSIIRVEVTNDLSYCTVYVSAIEGMEKAQSAVKGLKNAAGFIRSELAHRLSIRHVPALIFKATDSIEYSAFISKTLHDLEKKRPQTEEVSSDTEEEETDE